MEILDGTLDTAGNDHGPCLPSYLVKGYYLFVEMVHHDLGLEVDGIIMALNIPAELFLRSLGIKLGIFLHGLNEFVVAVHWCVITEHIQDEAFLYGLFHSVAVEGTVFYLSGILVGPAEELQGLVLGSGCKGEVTGIG